MCNVPMDIDLPAYVADNQFTASSYAGPQTVASAGRLYNKFSSWIPAYVFFFLLYLIHFVSILFISVFSWRFIFKAVLNICYTLILF